MENGDRVVKVLMELLDIKREEAVDSTNLRNDLGMDSFDLVEITMELEAEFDLKADMDDTDIKKLKTVKDVKDYIETQIRDRG